MSRFVTVAALVSILAGGARASDWPVFQHDSFNSGISTDAAGVYGLTSVWTSSVPGGLKFLGGTAPVISGQTVYAYAETDAVWNWATWQLIEPSHSYLVALSATSGAVKWVSQQLHDDSQAWGTYNGAGVDAASGDILVGSWSSLYRISHVDGAIIWQHDTGGTLSNVVVNGAPGIGNGKAYWMTGGGNGHLIGVDLSAGTGGASVAASLNVAMPQDVGGSGLGTPVLFRVSGTAYVAMNYGRAYGSPMGGGIQVVDAVTGSVLWSKSQAELPVGATLDQQAAYCFNGSMSYANGVLYARSYDDRAGVTWNGTLWAMDAATGSVLWKTLNQSGTAGVYDNVPNGHGTPIVADGRVYVGGGTGYWGGQGQEVQAYSAVTGERLWSVAGLGGNLNQMAYANGYLYVGSEDNNLLTLLNAATGTIVAQYQGAGSSPAIANGMIYTVDALGNMVALKGSILGDANQDGIVDQADYTLWYNSYGAANASWTDGDFNGDHLVDQADYTIWYNNYGSGGGQVPEPMTTAVLLAGSVAALVRRRR